MYLPDVPVRIIVATQAADSLTEAVAGPSRELRDVALGLSIGLLANLLVLALPAKAKEVSKYAILVVVAVLFGLYYHSLEVTIISVLVALCVLIIWIGFGLIKPVNKLRQIGLNDWAAEVSHTRDTLRRLRKVQTRSDFMGIGAGKFVNAKTFLPALQRGVQFRFLVLNPDSTEARQLATLAGKGETEFSDLIRRSVGKLRHAAERGHKVEVRFYSHALSYSHPPFRIWLIDGHAAVVSAYAIGSAGADRPQCEFVRTEGEKSFVRGFEELFRTFWDTGTEPDWTRIPSVRF